MDETLAVVPQRDQESNPKPLRSEAEESRGAGSAGLRQLRPDYTMSCWWGTLRFSVQGLSLSCYNSFHKGQLINTLLWGTEENEPFGGLRKTSPGDWSFFVHKAHKGIDWVPFQQETISLSQSQEEEEGSAESAKGHCSTAQCFCRNDVLLIKTQLHKWTHSI